MDIQSRLKSTILDVADFPVPGIIFKDITPVLADGRLFAELIGHYVDRYRGQGITQIVGIESRGFLLGAPVAAALGVGLTLVRKPGKLPRQTRKVTYDLEYGTDTLTMHADALTSADRVVILDDVLATGGTASATAELVESTGAQLHEFGFLMELSFLPGRQKMGERAVYSVLTY
jgi:adenine phosphoribosyltransferase